MSTLTNWTWKMPLNDEIRDEIARLTQHIANIEELAVCPECGGSLLSDHDLDCAYWGRETPAWLHGKNR